ncbi:MAG: hypothetical protein LBG08_02985 [Spirochaetaceae bacterium]|nr:hypothetical protein [Spirochaetaceae bacterium]
MRLSWQGHAFIRDAKSRLSRSASPVRGDQTAGLTGGRFSAVPALEGGSGESRNFAARAGPKIALGG